jgi:hypothetical protein
MIWVVDFFAILTITQMKILNPTPINAIFVLEGGKPPKNIFGINQEALAAVLAEYHIKNKDIPVVYEPSMHALVQEKVSGITHLLKHNGKPQDIMQAIEKFCRPNEWKHILILTHPHRRSAIEEIKTYKTAEIFFEIDKDSYRPHGKAGKFWNKHPFFLRIWKMILLIVDLFVF